MSEAIIDLTVDMAGAAIDLVLIGAFWMLSGPVLRVIYTREVPNGSHPS